MNADVVVIYWRDIPAQVVAKSGREKSKIELPERFQNAIDRAAMHAGLIGTDEYLTAWRRETVTVDAVDLAAAAAQMAEELERQFPPERLKQVATDGGVSEETE